MCQAFARNGHDMTLLAGEDRLDSEPGIDNVYTFYGVEPNFALGRIPPWRYPGRGWHHSWRSFKAVAALRPDLVYGRNVRACAMAALKGYPTILEMHTLRFARSAGDRVMLLALGRSAALKRVVVISSGLKTDLLRAVNLDADQILVAPDAADVAGEHGKPPELGSDPVRLRVGYVGHLYPGRGIELIRELADRLESVDFHIVGGHAADVDRVRESATLPRNLALHGFRPHRKAEAFRTHCDVLIAPYQYKVGSQGLADSSLWMSPLKIFEYMAAGKPIVCSDLPVLRKCSSTSGTALLVPPDDVEAWVSAITSLAEDSDLRRRLGAAAHQEFKERYTWQQRAQDVLRGVGLS